MSRCLCAVEMLSVNLYGLNDFSQSPTLQEVKLLQIILNTFRIQPIAGRMFIICMSLLICYSCRFINFEKL